MTTANQPSEGVRRATELLQRGAEPDALLQELMYLTDNRNTAYQWISRARRRLGITEKPGHCDVPFEGKPCGRVLWKRSGQCKAHAHGRQPRNIGSWRRARANPVKCSVSSCSTPVHAKGLCQAHYVRLRRGVLGALAPVKHRRRGPAGRIQRHVSLYQFPADIEYAENICRERGITLYTFLNELFEAWVRDHRLNARIREADEELGGSVGLRIGSRS